MDKNLDENLDKEKEKTLIEICLFKKTVFYNGECHCSGQQPK